MELVVAGLSHKTAPVSLRERVAFSSGEVEGILGSAGPEPALPERYLLSTCNRTELYAVAESAEEVRSFFLDLLSEHKGVDLEAEDTALYLRTGRETALHLMRVAASLDSMVVGERQILRQVREAAEIARSAGATGPVLHRLLEAAFRAGRRARAETEISTGAISVASAAITLARKIFSDISRRKALLVGSGETGTLAARHLRQHRIGELMVTSRTASHARDLAGELDAEALPFERLEEGMAGASIVVTATSSPEPVITREMVRRTLAARANRPLLIIDIAVPRDVEPAVGGLPNAFLYDIDSLEGLVEQSLESRRVEIPRVECIVEQEAWRFSRWHESLQANAVIRDLRARFEEIRAREVARYGRRFCASDRKELDALTRGLVNKLLHEPTVRIRGFHSQGAGSVWSMDAVRQLFGLPTVDEDDVD